MKNCLILIFLCSGTVFSSYANPLPERNIQTATEKNYPVETVRVESAASAITDLVKRRITYHPNALYNHIGGLVEATFCIDEEGSGINGKIITSAHPLLNDAVMRSIHFFKYQKMTAVREEMGEGPFKISVFFTPENPDTTKRVDIFPEYPAGKQAFRKFAGNQLSYPKMIRKDKVSGNVEVLADISAEGKIENPVVIKSPNALLDHAVIEVVNQIENLTPAKRKGEPISCRYVIEIPIGEDAAMEDMEPVNIPDSEPIYKTGNRDLLKYINSQITFPRNLIPVVGNGTHRAVVQFVVDRLGNVTNTCILKSSGYIEFDEEAMRVVNKIPKWKPAIKNGRPVRTNYTLPITFRK